MHYVLVTVVLIVKKEPLLNTLVDNKRYYLCNTLPGSLFNLKFRLSTGARFKYTCMPQYLSAVCMCGGNTGFVDIKTQLS